MASIRRIFYAYPNDPAAIGEVIENAVDKLKIDRGYKQDRVRFYTWTDLRIGGKPLVANILNEIDKSAVLACDLTYPNPNVAFELGYAIGRFKRIWMSVNSGVEDAEQRVRRMYFGLVGSGYAKYENSEQLVSAYKLDSPESSLGETLLGAHYKGNWPRNESPTLLYLKPPIATEAVIQSMDLLYESIFRDFLIVDDPTENQAPPLAWYSQGILSSDAVLVHMLSEEQRGNQEHNVKCSLVAGLARGFRKPVLMVAQKPFESPIDYQDLLRLHDTAGACKDAVSAWLTKIVSELPHRRSRRPEGPVRSEQGRDLRALTNGEPVAENERQRIDEYFLETASYFRALDDQLTIVVGRRGVGKSAQLYAMQSSLLRDSRNHVCVIKPVGYEIDGLVRVLQSIVHNSERGYLIESLWKYLIYSELARSLNEAIVSGYRNQDYGEKERHFVDYYHSRRQLFDPPFSERLDSAVKTLDEVGSLDDAVTQRRRISELLHDRELRELRQELGKALAGYRKVSILVDNLDSPWGMSKDVYELAQLLWGLMQVATDIVPEFGKQDHWRNAVNVYMTIFLRSDIFSVIQPKAPEQDKLPIQRIVWDDEEVLKRLIDARFEFGSPTKDTADQTWRHLFPLEVVGLTPWRFVINSVLPRPRDVVYLMREAVDGAINRGHSTVTPQDLLDARAKYSEYAFRSVIAEDDPRRGRLEDVLYEFAGSPRVVDREELERRFSLAGVLPEDFEFYLDLLCDVNFLAIGDDLGRFHYSRDEADREMKRGMAKRIARQRGTMEAFEVSSAFWQVLQIEQMRSD